MVGQGEGRKDSGESHAVNVQRFPTGDVIVHVFGELRDAAPMQPVVTEAVNESPHRLAVDLSAVTRVDAVGVRALASAAALTGEFDISFCLIGVRGPVMAAIGAAGLTELFEIYPSISEAWGR